MGKLNEKLNNIKSLPMHMPGHKRNTEKFPNLGKIYNMDITEIDGFDNLHAPSGILKETMENAARIFKSERSIYLINGSTCGIRAGISAILKDGDTVIVDRFSHKSVYNAIELSGGKPVYLFPEIHDEFGISAGITPDLAEKALSQNPDTKLLIITSPTYEGVVCDVEAICQVAKKYNVPVLVDSAHGAHLGFYNFPKSATQCNADIVIESLHKTLPSLTQTAILHTKSKYYNKIADRLSIFETSSPSYILMSSIESCVDFLEDETFLSEWYNNLTRFRKNARNLKNIKILENDGRFFDIDISKIVLFVKDAPRLSARLRNYGIEPEMTAPHYVICMTGAGDTKKSLDTLYNVLSLLDSEFSEFEKVQLYPTAVNTAKTIKAAKNSASEYIDRENSSQKIAAEYVWAYPPGIPIIAPGDIIDKKTLSALSVYAENNIELLGNSEHIKGKILVIST